MPSVDKVYLFSVMPEGYKELVISDGESYASYDCLRWGGRSKKATWEAPNLVWMEDEFTSNSDSIADFTAFGGGPVAVSDKAYRVLKDLFGEQVEFLPTNGPGPDDNWRLMNVVNVLDIMDSSKSKYEIYQSGKVGDCSHAFLKAPPEGNHIFLVNGCFPDVFINETAKKAIESSGLEGQLIREYINP